MIFYFSGTGNTRWAAMQISEKTNEKLVDITKKSVNIRPTNLTRAN